MSSHAVGRPLRFRLPVFTLVALVVLLLLIGGRLEASEISSSKSGDLWVCGPANAPPCRAPSPDAATVVAGARGYPIAFFWSGDADLIIAARLPGRLRVGGEMNGDLQQQMLAMQQEYARMQAQLGGGMGMPQQGGGSAFGFM